MSIVDLRTVSDLADYFAPLSNGTHLFRGQTAHYEDADGASVSSSFSRNGCIPPVMRQWSYYADSILHHLRETATLEIDIGAAQALLQHYGWRSFFVDVSVSPAVAAWFGSHKFSQSPGIEIVDLGHGEKVVTNHQYARYSPVDGHGVIYVLEMDSLAREGVAVVDLEGYLPADAGHSRISAQHAMLLGPLSTGRLPPRAIETRVQAPAEALREFAASRGLKATDDLFPNRDRDPILNCLLSVPWERVDRSIYSRGLKLPEYEPSEPERLGGDAFCSRRVWISRNRPPLLASAMFFRVPNALSYATGSPTGVVSPALDELVFRHGTVVLETDGLLMHPQLVGRPEFGKGVVLASAAEGTVEVSELIVEHPGTAVTLVAVNRGYKYRRAGERLKRVPSIDDCTCKDAARHEHLLSMATCLPAMSTRGDFKATAPNEVTHTEVAGAEFS
jgi:hypothetical protein